MWLCNSIVKRMEMKGNEWIVSELQRVNTGVGISEAQVLLQSWSEYESIETDADALVGPLGNSYK